ncbi:MAG TPA: hypothetical protein VKX46_20330 [Ktedonobacteraceae bacterium]|nr:hypothetical protein [Ktedonobacteraceae bacterium]
MSTQALSSPQTQSTQPKPLITGKKFDSIFCASILWLLGGTFADAWAHNNIPQLETFWTPWHGILYSGLLFLICSLTTIMIINRRRSRNWIEAIPQGYKAVFLAVGLMVLVGLSDMTWHLLFGVEQNIDALFSPTHLSGLICISLVATGPLYSMYVRRFTPSSFSDYFLLATAVLLPYILLVIALQSFSVFAHTWPVVTPVTFEIGQLAGIASMVIQATIFTFFVLYVTRFWTFKLGMFTYILGVVAIGLSIMNQLWYTIPVFLLGGVIVDLAYHFLAPSSKHLLEMRIFSAIAAGAPYAVYMIWVSSTMHVVWTIHMLVGTVYILLMLGWALSYLTYPPRRPAVDQPTKEE